MSTSLDVKDILSLIKDLDNNTNFNLYIPSLQKEIGFKQLTTEQLKRILKTVIDSPIYNTEFTLTLNSIIKENCLDKEINTENFTVYDKMLILFKTRIESISTELTLNFTDEEKDQFKGIEDSKVINLAEHFNSFIEKNISFQEETFELNKCILVCNLPTIQTENKLEKELHKNTKLEVSTTEELRNIVGETFINELVKYISQITVNEKTIDLIALPFKTRINIIESRTETLERKVNYYEETILYYINPIKIGIMKIYILLGYMLTIYVNIKRMFMRTICRY